MKKISCLLKINGVTLIWHNSKITYIIPSSMNGIEFALFKAKNYEEINEFINLKKQ